MQILSEDLTPTLVSNEAKLPREPFTLIPLGDIQYGAVGFADRTFKEYLSFVFDNYENPHFIGMGDYVDVASPSNRAALAGIKLYDSTLAQFEDAATRACDELSELLARTQGRWLGLLQGHHYWQYRDGTTSDTLLAMYLSTTYLRRCALVEMAVKRNDGQTRGKISMWVHHGAQGSSLAALGGLRKLTQLAVHFPDVDIFLMGHYHEAMSRTLSKLRWTGSRLISRPAVLGITGAWMRSYVENQGGYPEDRAYGPLSIGGLAIEVNPRIDTYGNFAPQFAVTSISI